MRRPHQQGSVAEVIPIMIIGVLLMLGVLQIALFMTGKHTVELDAYRMSRDPDAAPEFSKPFGSTEVGDHSIRLKMRPLVGSFDPLDMEARFEVTR